MNRMLALVLLLAPAAPLATASDPAALRAEADRRTAALGEKLVEWRRDLHQNPELGNRETRTSAKVAAHLKALGIEVTPLAKTGLKGVLKGGRPGPVVALRADMDALPVTEELDLPFKSTVRAEWGGREVGVMHACGHDAHVSMLMGAAEVLAGMRASLPGTVVFLFQPAEEGLPPGEEGGAELMVREGALVDPKVEAVFGLHVFPMPTGTLGWRAGGIMASSDMFEIRLRGRQTHGAMPWSGVDPIVAGAELVLSLQAIVSREIDPTASPAIVTVGSFQAGNRPNIVPEEVVMSGTVRTFDAKMREQIKAAIGRRAEAVAAATGTTAAVSWYGPNPVTWNDPALAAKMSPTLQRVGGALADPNVRQTTTAEDFSYYQEKVPGLFAFLGVNPAGRVPEPNHSPRFFVDEAVLPVGVRALAHLALDSLSAAK